jgi:D-glycero-D-manno-heptose 1,7-bisphosphate phosphatase
VSPSSRVIFLDRDGTINVDHGYVSEIERWQFIPATAEALCRLRSSGYRLAVVSNQAGIAEGRFRTEAVYALHDFMVRELAADGVALDAIAFCPHGRSGCDCRKPLPGLARVVESETGPIDYAASWVEGDKESDIGFGRAIGARMALIRSHYWTPDSLQIKPDLIVDSLLEFSSTIT